MQLIKKSTINDIIERAKICDSFAYQILSRMESDCKYWLGNGNKRDSDLWAGEPYEQIQDMLNIWDAFPEGEKPEWLSKEDILSFAVQMDVDVNNPPANKDYTISFIDGHDLKYKVTHYEARSLNKAMHLFYKDYGANFDHSIIDIVENCMKKVG